MKEESLKHQLRDFMASLTTYDSDQERRLRDEACKTSSFIGTPAAGETANILWLVSSPGTFQERIVQVAVSDIDSVIELAPDEDPITGALLRRVRVSLRAGAPYSVVTHFRAFDPGVSANRYDQNPPAQFETVEGHGGGGGGGGGGCWLAIYGPGNAFGGMVHCSSWSQAQAIGRAAVAGQPGAWYAVSDARPSGY